MATFCSWPYPVRLRRSSQLVFAVPNIESLAGSCTAVAARNCAALSTEASLVTDDAEALVVYSICVPWRPPPPDLVVMSTTPLAAFVP